MQAIRLLAVSGSLRAASTNTVLLHAASMVAPQGVSIVTFTRLGEFPLFNPDAESSMPAPVQAFREQINAADGVLIASPEYAHGVTGVMKNALDWVVGTEAFVYKPTAVFNASPRATHADAALKETLTVMSADLVGAASIALPVLGAKLDAAGIAGHPELGGALHRALDALRQHIVDRRLRISDMPE